MDEKNYQNLSKDISDFLDDSFQRVNEIKSYINVVHDYCGYNLEDDVSCNIINLMENLKEKIEKLAENIDSKNIEIFNNKSLQL